MRLYGVYGASGFGREIMPLARQAFDKDKADLELVFIDDHASESPVNGHRVLTWNAFIAAPAEQKAAAIAIANSQMRQKLAERCTTSKVGIFSVYASNIVMMDDVKIAEGSLLSPFVTLTSNIRIGRFFHANIYSYIAHNCLIGDYVTFAPSVRCNGNIIVEDHAYIGTGAIIKQGQPGNPLVIGRGAVIGMGAVVTKSVPAGMTVVGNPARPFVKG